MLYLFKVYRFSWKSHEDDVLKNFGSDDWINDVYQPNFYYPLFNHHCENSGGKPRYFIGTHSNSSNKNNQETLNSQAEILYKMISQGRNKLFTYFNPKNNKPKFI